jgi:hypothetical protein
MNQNNCSIVVSSCDNFSDAWDPFFKLFFKYWPDCPFKIYLIAEKKKYEDSRVTTIMLGEDKHWASNLKISLQKINTPYFIYLQEDYLLKSTVDTKKIVRLLDILVENKGAYMKLRPSPVPQKRFKEYTNVGEIEKDTKYSISNQATIWHTKTYEDFLVHGETGWDTEFRGSARSHEIKEPFLSVYEDVLDYPKVTAIKKGIWMYDAIKLCEKEGIKIDRSKRKIETPLHYYFRITHILPIIDRLNLLLSAK